MRWRTALTTTRISKLGHKRPDSRSPPRMPAVPPYSAHSRLSERCFGYLFGTEKQSYCASQQVGYLFSAVGRLRRDTWPESSIMARRGLGSIRCGTAKRAGEPQVSVRWLGDWRMYRIALLGAGRIARVDVESIVGHARTELANVVDADRAAVESISSRCWTARSRSPRPARTAPAPYDAVLQLERASGSRDTAGCVRSAAGC